MQRWILLLNQQFPVRYAAWLACAMLFVWGGVRELQGRVIGRPAGRREQQKWPTSGGAGRRNPG